jgi:hypothetical protein
MARAHSFAAIDEQPFKPIFDSAVGQVIE